MSALQRFGKFFGVTTKRGSNDAPSGSVTTQKIQPLRGITPEYDPIRTPNGVLVKLQGIELLSSSAQDFSYFPRGSFTPAQLDLDRRIEADVQHSMLGAKREYSGWYGHRHIEQGLEAAFRNSKMANLQLYLPFLIMWRLHDWAEDNPIVMAKQAEWESLLKNRAGYSSQIHRLECEIAAELERLKNETIARFRDKVPQGIGARERTALFRDIAEGVEGAWAVTRAKYRDIYAHSILQIFTIGRGGHGVILKKLDHGNAKVIDRFTNAGDYTPNPPEILNQLILAFDDPRSLDGIVIGEELTRRFGEISYGKEMPPAVQIGTAVKSLYVLQYAYEQIINKYGARITNGRYGQSAQQKMKMMLIGLDQVLKSTLNLLDTAIRTYESDPDILAIKGEVDEKVERLRHDPEFMTHVKEGDPLIEWIRLDARGKSYLESLDLNIEKKRAAYEHARLFSVFFPQYAGFYPIGGDTSNLQFDREVYDPRRHNFFTIGLLEEAISLQYGPRSAKNPTTLRRLGETFVL